MNDNHRRPDHDLDDLDPVAVDRLRRTLHAVAATTPVEDRRAALLTALEPSAPPEPSEEDSAMHLDTTTPALHRPIWRRPAFLAAAAALVAVAIAGVAYSAARDEAVELDPAVPDAGLSTGWFVPPEGWEITEVRADFVDVGEMASCPCRSLVAAGEGEGAPALVVWETGQAPLDLDGEPVDVGGRPGQLVDDGLPSVVAGTDAGHVWVVGSRVDQSAMVELADAWLDRLEAGADVDPSALPLPDGMTAGVLVASPAVRSAHVVDVTAVEAATGRRTYYQLAPAGHELASMILDSAAVERHGDRFVFRTTIGSTPVVGFAGGIVDVAAGPSFFAEEGDLDAEELRAFLGGLRQVSGADWAAALVDAEVDPRVQEAESLFGPPLVDG